MAIETNDAIEKFGTQDTLNAAGASATFGEYKLMGTWTNTEGVKTASIVFIKLRVVTVPTRTPLLHLYARPLNLRGTDDSPTPSDNYRQIFIGTLVLEKSNANQNYSIDVSLPNSKAGQEYEFYFENDAQYSLSSLWEAYITPKSVGPKV